MNLVIPEELTRRLLTIFPKRTGTSRVLVRTVARDGSSPIRCVRLLPGAGEWLGTFKWTFTWR